MEYLGLVLHEITHFSLSLLAILCAWLFLRIKKPRRLTKLIPFVVLGGFLGEFFLDIDHLFDYVLAYGFQFRPDLFFQGKMFAVLHKTYVPFHAWEWVILLCIIIFIVKKQPMRAFLIALMLGVTFHMIYDTFYNHYSFLGYSLIYRFLHDFDVAYLS